MRATVPRSSLTAKQVMALDLRRQGLQYHEIGERMGIKAPAAHRLLVRALERLPVEDIEAVRALELVRYDQMLRDVDAAICQVNPDEDVYARYQDLRLKIAERRAKLLGLDAPKLSQTEHTFGELPNASEIEAAIKRALESRGYSDAGVIDAEVVEPSALPPGAPSSDPAE